MTYYVYPVVDGGLGFQHAVTLVDKEVELCAGERMFLTTTPLRASRKSWGTGSATNIMVGHYLRIYEGTTQKMIAHHVENITPSELIIHPEIRATFTAPEAGTYRVELVGRAASSNWAPGMEVRLYGYPDVLVQKSAFFEGWGAPAGDSRVQASGNWHYRMPYTINGVSDQNMTLVADAEMSTCNYTTAHGGLCQYSGFTGGSNLQTKLVVQSYDINGNPVGNEFASDVFSRYVPQAKHHVVVNHEIATYFAANAHTAVVRLAARVTSGNDMVFHGGHGYAHGSVLRYE